MHDLSQVVTDVLAVTPTGAPTGAPNTEGLATWLRDLFGPLLLVVISIVAMFFLFTRELTRFFQFIVLAVIVLVVFYFPGIFVTIAQGIAQALGIKADGS